MLSQAAIVKFLTPVMLNLPKIPIILVQDFSLNPPITTHYIHRDNEISLFDAEVTRNRLSEHPGRGRVQYVVDPNTRRTGKFQVPSANFPITTPTSLSPLPQNPYLIPELTP
jgi:hypothetical protein